MSHARTTLPSLVLLALLGGVGCGPSASLELHGDDFGEESDALASTESTIIVGELNWQSVTRLEVNSPAARVARAVGYLDIPAEGKRCTAWLAGPSSVVTNEHCINTADQAKGARVTFDYVSGVAAAQRRWFLCESVELVNVALDLTVLGCRAEGGELPGDVYGTLDVAPEDVADGTNVYVIHQNCDYKTARCLPTKKYSPGRVTEGALNGTELSYDADTLGGSSGAPVFSTTTHKVVGLHHQGVGDTQKNGRGIRNEAIRARLLRNALAEIGL